MSRPLTYNMISYQPRNFFLRCFPCYLTSEFVSLAAGNSCYGLMIGQIISSILFDVWALNLVCCEETRDAWRA